ncbi:fibroin heavy chain-like isoform X6 [Sarcophilus harrisii]|uniref:fibroin heavy chain-like isoform X6 n=1 Tax=Sarcophilus harrisii TaxID=9305 RepID=UPI001301B174|nr:fibroin heavy chain-like isoform X6 [Sarcophilus harrisii]
MDSWVFPTSMLLLCLIQGSQQGGLAPQGNGIMGWFFSSTHMKGIPPGAGPGAGAGIPPGKAGYGTLSNGYGTGAPNGAGAGPQGPETKAGYRNGLGAGIFPGAGAQPGLGGGMKPQKAAYRNGLGNGAFPGAGAQPGLGAGTKPQKPGYGNGLGNGIFPGVGAQPGGGMKPQKAGFGAGTKIQNAGFRTQNGYGPVSPPGLENGLKTQKTGLRNILGAGSFPGARIQPGYGAMNGYGTGLGGVKSQNTGYGNGFGAGAFPETGPQPGFGTLNGFGGGPGGVKPRKAIYSNGLGAGTFPEVQQTGFPGAGSYAANGYSNGYGAGGPGYPKPSLYENGGASSFGAQGVPFLSGGSETGAKTAKHDFGNGVGTGSYPADESPPGLYGQLRPEPVPGTYGGPDVKHNFNGFLGNGYRGRCPPGKC